MGIQSGLNEQRRNLPCWVFYEESGDVLMGGRTIGPGGLAAFSERQQSTWIELLPELRMPTWRQSCNVGLQHM